MRSEAGNRGRLGARGKSGRGLPHSKTLPRSPAAHGWREASWSAPALWRFGADVKMCRRNLSPQKRIHHPVDGDFFGRGKFSGTRGKSGRGLPHSKTLPRSPAAHGRREASWSAVALWRFGVDAISPARPRAFRWAGWWGQVRDRVGSAHLASLHPK